MNELKEKMLEDTKETEHFESKDKDIEDLLVSKIIKFIQEPLILFIIFFSVTYKPNFRYFLI